MIQHILKPFESWTGIECVANHAEPDEEEDVEDYEVTCQRRREGQRGVGRQNQERGKTGRGKIEYQRAHK